MTSSQRTRRGTSLTVKGSGVAVYPPGATFGPRGLEDFEFVWLLQGTAEWRYDLGSVALGPNSLLLGRPGIQDSFIWDRTRPTRHAYLHFQLVGRLSQLPDPAHWPLVRALPDDDPLRPLLRYLLSLGKQRSGSHQQTTQEVLRLLLTLFVQGPLPDRDSELGPAHLDTLLDFVRAAWSPPAPTRPLPLRDLAAGACISTSYLSRVFRHHFGIGPVAAFELLRLARAATLLVRSNLSVTAVAHDCGFANPYHFSRRFRWVYGQPPGRYRHASPRLHPTEPLAQAGLLALSDHIWQATQVDEASGPPHRTAR
jgi:AraC family transcriptional regulator